MKFITIKTKSDLTVLINTDQIVSVEFDTIKEEIKEGDETLTAEFLQVTIITTKYTYVDKNLYADETEIKYLDQLVL